MLVRRNDQKIRDELHILSSFMVPIDDRLSVCILPNRKKHTVPGIIYELGRQRKKAFGEKGAGGNALIDLDVYDDSYHQMLVLLNTSEKYEIIAGYRFFIHTPEDRKELDMERLFDMSKFFSKSENLPAIELGRSFIIPKYQKQPSVFSALFSGLGVILQLNRESRFYFGKITFYPSNPHNTQVLQFLKHYHPDTKEDIVPKYEIPVPDNPEMAAMGYRNALKLVRGFMPEILKIYLRTTEPRYAVVSGSSRNDAFGPGIIETAFRISIPNITAFWKHQFYDKLPNVSEHISL